MKATSLTPALSVSPQLTESDIEEAAAAGYRSLINNRPDGEEPGQPSSASLEAAARRHGLAYRHIPVVGGQIADAQIAAFRDALAEAEGPALAFCRSGTRSTGMWALAMAGRAPTDEILKTASNAGYNLEPLRPRIEDAGKGSR